ncbi:unnamed protein product [Acanthoscelides obtectus]|uniref:MADF domain-containing protein n=1 Tax=Acanthoscelides obtectus TaxID=200917 RepID=A0A9P0Q8A4_ACAOB|nr:unnamed protein product [Acanthoscelides obtectus]CAK1626004.1 hypothetical protein AOBTE_LOCUS3540 [Acanthoscelides obtectus]
MQFYMITDDRITATEVHKTRHGNKYKKKISANVSECKDRWKNIRGSYSKYRAKLQTKSGQGAKRVKEYYLAPHLLFLDPFLKSRKSKGNIAEESALSADEETDSNEYEENGNIEVQSPDYILSTHSSHSPIPSPSTSVDDHLLAMKAPKTPSRKGDDLRK